MIRISITPAAFDAIAATLPLGSVMYEPQRARHTRTGNASGDCLSAMRGAGQRKPLQGEPDATKSPGVQPGALWGGLPPVHL